ncbi:class I SAM-dependent methyltransferase [Rubrobacter radiotolerans]|uniref:Class I SAM-dependent methyltransferase n=1 Tax=Rubrobacter radiotolerans TaxID=42256 RepID=A0AB35T8T9_RUBRA|nr:class I SAM-dependent methyltransferase [Rubrobacter radiotolerans]MDX5893190.1 class I SAM-dependent methyltransferase [Rubrobacter radiotolerans]
MRRSVPQKALDFVTFPLRAVMPFRAGERERWGLTSRASERLEYAAGETVGYTLDIGCGPKNRLVNEYLGGNGFGIDVFDYDGSLGPDQVFEDLTSFPFRDASFDSATLVATLHHIPRSQRDAELKEVYRVIRPGGNVVLTQALPLAEILIHKITRVHARLFGKHYDIDLLREMHEEEEDHVTDEEIVERLARAGFRDIEKKPFLTQWGVNRAFVGWKR